jgi:hypothetical protein
MSKIVGVGGAAVAASVGGIGVMDGAVAADLAVPVELSG